jgi:hypothetical protein
VDRRRLAFEHRAGGIEMGHTQWAVAFSRMRRVAGESVFTVLVEISDTKFWI